MSFASMCFMYVLSVCMYRYVLLDARRCVCSVCVSVCMYVLYE